jgi:hypothetical protein
MRWAVAGCVVLAAASLAVSATPSFDAWGWALWGRELTGHGTFSTAQYPSWKPLPALIDTVLAALSPTAEPTAWLVIARAPGLLALVLAARIAARFGGVAAGLLAAAGLALAPDWWQLLGAGSADPMLVAVVLGAVDRHLEGRERQALALGVLAALLRPETWPFVALYAARSVWRRGPWGALVAGGAVALVPLLWFGGDWLGSGSPWTGSHLARVADEAQQLGTGSLRPHASIITLARCLTLVTPPLLGGVLVALRARRELRGLTAGALAMIAFVAGAAGLGYGGLARYALPAGAVLCAVGAVGAVGLLEALGRAERGRAVPALVATAALLAGLPSAVSALRGLHAAQARGELATDVRAALRDLEISGALAACHGRLAAAPPAQPALAVALGRPVTSVNGFARARIVIGPVGSWRWPEVRRWLRRHPARLRASRPSSLRGLVVYEACSGNAGRSTLASTSTGRRSRHAQPSGNGVRTRR